MEASVDNLVRAFACHLIAVQAQNASPKTLLLYDGRHKQFLTFLLQQGLTPPFHLDDLNAANVRRAAIWIRERSRGHRGGESAARALVSTLKTTSAWLADEEYIEADLVARVKRPRVNAIARTPFSRDEVRELRHAALDSRHAARDTAIICLLLDTGMRVGGLCSILLDDLSLRDRRVVLRLKGGREHVLYFGSANARDGGRAVRVLKQYLSDRAELVRRWDDRGKPGRHRGYLFLGFDGWPLTPPGVRAILSRLAAESGLPHVFPHRFRHTMATNYLVEHPGDETGLRGILGHLSDDMYRVYAHLAHEIIAQRAGRAALSESWLGDEDVG
jgi:site-specific recombinase XerD